MGRQISSVQMDDEKINRIQSNILPPLNALINITFLDGVLLKDQALASGTTSVDYKLGRKLSGYLILKQNAQASIWLGSATDTTASFGSSNSVTVDLWVF